MEQEKKLIENPDRAPIVTQEDLDLVMTKEKNKFYLTMSGRLVSINGKSVFDKQELDFQKDQLLDGLRSVLATPVDQREYMEAVEGIKTVRIYPFRLH